MAYTQKGLMDRSLTDVEENWFREWARYNYAPGDLIAEYWHPVVKEECGKISKEYVDGVAGAGVVKVVLNY